MGKRLILTTLIPEPLELEINGTFYPATPLDALSSEQQQNLVLVHRRLTVGQVQLRNASDMLEQAKAGGQLLRTLGEFVKLLVPTIADADLAALTAEQQLEVIQWWFDEHPDLKQSAVMNQKQVKSTSSPRAQGSGNSQPASFGRSTKANQRRYGKHRNG